MERFKKVLKDIPSTVLRQERRWNRNGSDRYGDTGNVKTNNAKKN